jgi:hypothetical protein
MHGLSFDTKALAHIGDGEQAEISFQVVGDSGQMHAERTLTQLLGWPSILAPVCLYGTSSLSSLLLRNGTMVLQHVQQPLLIMDGHPCFLRFGQL